MKLRIIMRLFLSSLVLAVSGTALAADHAADGKSEDLKLLRNIPYASPTVSPYFAPPYVVSSPRELVDEPTPSGKECPGCGPAPCPDKELCYRTLPLNCDNKGKCHGPLVKKPIITQEQAVLLQDLADADNGQVCGAIEGEVVCYKPEASDICTNSTCPDNYVCVQGQDGPGCVLKDTDADGGAIPDVIISLEGEQCGTTICATGQICISGKCLADGDPIPGTVVEDTDDGEAPIPDVNVTINDNPPEQEASPSTCKDVTCDDDQFCINGSCIDNPVKFPTLPVAINDETTTTTNLPEVIPPWFDMVKANFTGTRLRRCYKRTTPPTEGRRCASRPKTCYFGSKTCSVGSAVRPAIRCYCSGEAGGRQWSCQDVDCNAAFE